VTCLPALRASEPPTLAGRSRIAAECLFVLYIAGIAQLARVLGIPYLLFPELGALAHEVLTRPRGTWAGQPLRLIATPALTAVVGTIVTRHLPLGGWSVVLTVGASVVAIAALRSSIAPAMSAGVLPLVLGVKSWVYPPAILLTLSVLAAISVLWRRRHSAARSATGGDVDGILESQPRGRYWHVTLLVFVAAAAEAARMSGLRFILFPPLVTMAYEMFGHPGTCPWRKRPASLPAACLLVAGGGLLAVQVLGAGFAAAAASMVFGVLVLRVFDLHMPPALAVGLLPSVMSAPGWQFPLAVGAGALGLTGSFLFYRRMGIPVPDSEAVEAG
jgi:hypothetical protein